MWETRSPTTLWAITACYRNSFTFYDQYFTMIHSTFPLLLCFPNSRSATFSAANPGNHNSSIFFPIFKKSYYLCSFIFTLRISSYVVKLHHSAFTMDLVYTYIFQNLYRYIKGLQSSVPWIIKSDYLFISLLSFVCSILLSSPVLLPNVLFHLPLLLLFLFVFIQPRKSAFRIARLGPRYEAEIFRMRSRSSNHFTATTRWQHRYTCPPSVQHSRVSATHAPLRLTRKCLIGSTIAVIENHPSKTRQC
jgi:hypothetical protein